MKRVFLIAVMVLSGGVLSAAPTIPWRVPEYTLTARNLPVREALETFAVAEGVPAILSENVKGVFSGDFSKVPAEEFLDRLATIHNLTWYYDGASLWIYAAGETLTTLIDLRYMKAAEVLQLMRELGVEDGRYPLKEASNSELIMVSGPPRYVTLVVEMIGKADRLREQRTFTEIETRLFPLVHTWADNVSFNRGTTGFESQLTIQGVAYLLQEIMTASGSGRVQEGTNSAPQAANGQIQPVIRPENRLNAVLVRDAASRMPMYEDLIRQLDKPQKLVEIGVTVLEMSKEDALDWQASVTVGFNDSRNKAFLAQNGNALLNDASEAVLAGLTGGYSYLGEHVNVSASIHALKSKGKARSIFRTSLLTLNNMMAEIDDTESYTTKLVGEKVASTQETSAGTKLAIKPRIVEPPKGSTNVARQIWLTMELRDGGFDMLTTVDSLPTKRQTTLDTQAALPEGHSLLLAGYFRDIEEESGWGIPYLREIPWIGWIFGGAAKVKTTVQRMFILTPHVVDLDYYAATTQDVTTVQMLRQRDITHEQDLQESAHSDDWVRKHREADLKEKRDIRDEREKEKYERDDKERGLRTDRRKAERRDDHDAWMEDFKARERKFEDEQREKAKKEVHEELTGLADGMSPQKGDEVGQTDAAGEVAPKAAEPTPKSEELTPETTPVAVSDREVGFLKLLMDESKNQ